jgi:small subunit ribosomal protein S18
MKIDACAAKGEGGRTFRRRGMGRRKVCRFCADKTLLIDYKDPRAGIFSSAGRSFRAVSRELRETPASARARNQRARTVAPAVHDGVS